tara:strand:- start:265 stop:693 length:429 start_codon:yes stop_codon:yes gene_type:complete
MKRLLFIFFPILLTSCTSVDSIFSPIQTIKCKQIASSGFEATYQPKTDKSKVIIFNKNTGKLFFYDDFYETLTDIGGDKEWIQSTIVNGKLKINQGDKRVWGKAIIDLNDLTGEYLYISSQYKKTEWDLKCVRVKNPSTKIK